MHLIFYFTGKFKFRQENTDVYLQNEVANLHTFICGFQLFAKDIYFSREWQRHERINSHIICERSFLQTGFVADTVRAPEYAYARISLGTGTRGRVSKISHRSTCLQHYYCSCGFIDKPFSTMTKYTYLLFSTLGIWHLLFKINW